MEKGYNSDVTVRGLNFHVQTEDWGKDQSVIVTKVFRNGAVIKSIKTTYNEVLKLGPRDVSQALRLGMREQHQRILDQLAADQF